MPFAAMCVLTLVDRGVVDLDAAMQCYWPDLQARASVRDVLSHRAGVVMEDGAPAEAFYDLELMCLLLARQEPSCTPGSAQGESALFYGHLLEPGGPPGRRPLDSAVPSRRGLRARSAGPIPVHLDRIAIVLALLTVFVLVIGMDTLVASSVPVVKGEAGRGYWAEVITVVGTVALVIVG